MRRSIALYALLLAAFLFSAGCSTSWEPDAGGALEVRCAIVSTGQNMMGWPVMRLICRPEKDMPDAQQKDAPRPGQTGV